MFFNAVVLYFISYLFFLDILALTLIVGVSASPSPRKKRSTEEYPQCNENDLYHQNQMKELKTKTEVLRTKVGFVELELAKYDSTPFRYSILTKVEMPEKSKPNDLTNVRIIKIFIILIFILFCFTLKNIYSKYIMPIFIEP